MSQITLTDAVFYKDGAAGYSKVVGFESGVTRVARYSFQSPQNGATELTFQLDSVSKGNGADIPLRFAISTDPNAYCNAGANSPYTGIVSLNLSSHCATGTAQVRLLPNVVYYLWLFPGKNQWGWYYVPSTGSVTTSGAAQGVATAEPGTLGLPMAITIYGTDHTHRLTWEFGDYSGTIGENLGQSVLWTPPLELANAIPNARSGDCIFTCYSYLDGVQVGDPQISYVTLSVPVGMAPRVSARLTNTADALGVYVEKVSKLEVTVTTTCQYGASLVSTAITLDGEPYAGAALTPGEHHFIVSATDSRGLTGKWETWLQVLPYNTPTLELHASRCQADGTPDDTGDHALVTIRGATTQIAGNTARLTLTYGKTAVEIPVEVGAFETTTLIPADPNETLYIKARIADALKGTTRTMTLSTGYPTMEFLSGGKGIAFGQVASSEGFHCAMDATFSGKVLDAQGRPWVVRYDLTAVTGMYLTPIYGRVLDVLGAGFLQLKFTSNRNRSAGDTLYSCDIPLTEDITVTDTTGKYKLTLTPTGVVTPNALSTGTYTFHTLLY